jgi:hypothetical protein
MNIKAPKFRIKLNKKHNMLSVQYRYEHDSSDKWRLYKTVSVEPIDNSAIDVAFHLEMWFNEIVDKLTKDK